MRRILYIHCRSKLFLPAAVATFILGCRTTNVEYGSVRPLPPDPKPARPVPSGANANAMALAVEGKPADTDGNGYPDTIVVSMYLFSLPHASPMFEDGTFVFTLQGDGDADVDDVHPLGQWRLDADQVERGRTIYGPTHLARLSLLEIGSDRYPLMSANLHCRFEPANGGDAISPRGVHWVQLGRAQTARR